MALDISVAAIGAVLAGGCHSQLLHPDALQSPGLLDRVWHFVVIAFLVASRVRIGIRCGASQTDEDDQSDQDAPDQDCSWSDPIGPDNHGRAG